METLSEALASVPFRVIRLNLDRAVGSNLVATDHKDPLRYFMVWSHPAARAADGLRGNQWARSDCRSLCRRARESFWGRKRLAKGVQWNFFFLSVCETKTDRLEIGRFLFSFSQSRAGKLLSWK